jgi:NAD-dependent deacetylase
VWDWYEHRREQLSAVAPNAGHVAIAELEQFVPQVVVVTQNIDGLHQRAGSTDVILLHGDIQRHRCFAGCQGNPTYIDIDAFAWDRDDGPPPCPHCGAWVRPDVVWFGETLPPGAFARAEDLCRKAQVVLVVGTSGEVQPAASLPPFACRHGAHIIEVNPNVSAITRHARVFLQGPSGEVLPRLAAAARQAS